MGALYSRYWPDATPGVLAQLIELFGKPEEEVFTSEDIFRRIE